MVWTLLFHNIFFLTSFLLHHVLVTLATFSFLSALREFPNWCFKIFIWETIHKGKDIFCSAESLSYLCIWERWSLQCCQPQSLLKLFPIEEYCSGLIVFQMEIYPTMMDIGCSSDQFTVYWEKNTNFHKALPSFACASSYRNLQLIPITSSEEVTIYHHTQHSDHVTTLSLAVLTRHQRFTASCRGSGYTTFVSWDGCFEM